MKQSYTIISLFSGCGGLDLGFEGGFTFLNKEYSKHKFEIIWANDIDSASCLSFKRYFKKNIVCGDIGRILDGDKSAPTEDNLPISADIVLGGFPCQDFSHAGKRRGFSSDRGLLYQRMIQAIARARPLIFLAENVRGLITMNQGRAIKTIIEDFSRMGYHVTYKLLNAADFGVPQIRQRVIIIGTRKDALSPFNFPEIESKEAHWVNLKDAIGDLEKIPEGKIPNHYWSKAKKNNGQGNSVTISTKPGPTMRSEHHGNIEWHWNGTRRLSAREAARIQSFPDDFIFYPSTSAAYKQIGNAVPPVMAWHIAKYLQEFLDMNLKK